MASSTTRRPAEVRELGDRYQLALTGRVGNTASRVIVFLLAQVLFFMLGYLVASFLTERIGWGRYPWVLIFGLGTWVFLGLYTAPNFIVNVVKMVGLVVTNLFSGRLHVFITGLSVKFPWEVFNSEKDYYDLRTISVEYNSRFVVKGGVGKDGKAEGAVGINFRWTVQYAAFIPLLALYVQKEIKAIAEGLVEVVENALTEAISHYTIDQLLEKKTVDALQKKLALAFKGMDVDGRIATEFLDEFGSTLEERFGIRIELSTLGPPKFDKDYEEAQAAQAIRNIIIRDASSMAEELQIPREKAAKIIMMLNKEAVSETIHTIQFDERVAGAAEDIGRVLKAGESIVRTIPPSKGGSGDHGHSSGGH